MTDEQKLQDHVEKIRIAGVVRLGLEICDESPKAGKCPHCERDMPDIARRRLNTAYVDDESNWTTCCSECFQESIEHYNDLWDTYHYG